MIAPFAEGFAYDRWANLEWTRKLHVLEEAELAVRSLAATNGRDPDVGPLPVSPALRVMAHIGFAHRVWLERVGVSAPELDVSGEKKLRAAAVGEALSMAESAWKPVLVRSSDEVIAYQNLRGEPQARKLGEIISHVLNHGTYHRGQVRQMIADLGVSDFPDTDYLYFVMARDAGRLPS